MSVLIHSFGYGKRKAMLVELELDNNYNLARMAHDRLSNGGGGSNRTHSMPPTSLSRA